MITVNVSVHVKSKSIDDFISATIENARNSNNEPGIARFDIIQQKDDKTRFMLIEVYKDENAPAAHKETEHYKKWRDTVESMMATPRSSEKFSTIFTKDTGYTV